MDTFDPNKSLADQPHKRVFDFQTCTIEELKKVDLVMQHTMSKTAILHGYAMYFDAYFDGTDQQHILHTGPHHPATHWYQTRLLLPEPLGVNRTQTINCTLNMLANAEQTYDTSICVTIPQLGLEGKFSYDMKDAEYRGCYQSYADYYNNPS